MTTRRAVIQAGVALAAATGAGAGALGSALRSSHALQFYRVAYDGRFVAARSFAAAVRELGGQTHDTEGDITSFWYRDLYHRWRSQPAAVAGMTTFDALLGLSMMASGAGLRVIFRAHHHLDRQPTTHEFFGPVAVLRGLNPLPRSERGWGGAVADLLMRWPATALAVARPASTYLDAARSGVAAESLVSWIIAPHRRGQRLNGVSAV